MEGSRLRWIAAVVVALTLGFLIGTWRTGATVQTGRVEAKGAGGGSIVTRGWTYGFGSDVAWTDDMGLWHNGGTPGCLPAPLSSRHGVSFASIEVSGNGNTWRPVVWIDCRSPLAP